MSARVLSGREALQEWLLVCVNLARRSGVLTHHSNEQRGDQARDWVTVTGIRPQNTVSTEEAYAMAEQLSQAFASAAIEYAKGAPDADAKLQDALLASERDTLIAKVAKLESEAELLRREVHRLKVEARGGVVHGDGVGPLPPNWPGTLQRYAGDDASSTIRLARQTEALTEIANRLHPSARWYILSGGDQDGEPEGSGRAAYLDAVDQLFGNGLALLAIAVGMDRERSQDGMLEPDENLRSRLRTWNQAPISRAD